MKYKFCIKFNHRTEPLDFVVGDDYNAGLAYKNVISCFTEGCKNSEKYDGSMITCVFTDDFNLYQVAVCSYKKP